MLQPARVTADGRIGLAVRDFFDFSVYVDAATHDIRRWYTERFLRLRETAFRDPASYFQRYAHLSEERGSRPGASGSGTRSTAPTSTATSSRRAAGPPWCCARTPTTPCATSACASSDPHRVLFPQKYGSRCRLLRRTLKCGFPEDRRLTTTRDEALLRASRGRRSLYEREGMPYLVRARGHRHGPPAAGAERPRSGRVRRRTRTAAPDAEMVGGRS